MPEGLYFSFEILRNLGKFRTIQQFSVFNNLEDAYIISAQPHIIKKNIFIDISNYCLQNIVKQKKYCGPQVFEIYGPGPVSAQCCLARLSVMLDDSLCLLITIDNVLDLFQQMRQFAG